jgi:thioester reductase-like protein
VRGRLTPLKNTILLTGATGLLGRYLLRKLLRSGRQVAVLVRASQGMSPRERIDALRARWDETLPRPDVVEGDIALDGIGLTAVDRQWLARHVGAVVHAAANTSFRAAPDGEPWQTNVAGTEALLRLARDLRIQSWHQVSTAFVCGRRRGLIQPEELDCGQQFHNPYEQSKYAAEHCIRAMAGLNATVYRPAVMVGDSETGYTCSYAGLYRFLELGARLATLDAAGAGGRRLLPLRLALRGDERCNLVPVDWVARAIATILERPALHGRTYHLVARVPTPVRAIHDVATEMLGLCGVELVGPGNVVQPSRLEEMFREGVADYWPYLEGSPRFCDQATAAALPYLPPPLVDRVCLRRLIHFAQADRWGRGVPVLEPRRKTSEVSETSKVSAYFEQTFPRQARASSIARIVGLDVLVGFDVRGAGGGEWSCRWTAGELAYVRRGLEDGAVAVYRTNVPTFWTIVQGELSPQHAFFEQRVAIDGDLETALKLATLFEHFLHEQRFISQHTEALGARDT